MVWIKVLRTGAEWEVPEAHAEDLVKWSPNDYAIIADPTAKALESAHTDSPTKDGDKPTDAANEAAKKDDGKPADSPAKKVK